MRDKGSVRARRRFVVNRASSPDVTFYLGIYYLFYLGVIYYLFYIIDENIYIFIYCA